MLSEKIGKWDAQALAKFDIHFNDEKWKEVGRAITELQKHTKDLVTLTLNTESHGNTLTYKSDTLSYDEVEHLVNRMSDGTIRGTAHLSSTSKPNENKLMVSKDKVKLAENPEQVIVKTVSEIIDSKTQQADEKLQEYNKANDSKITLEAFWKTRLKGVEKS